MSLRPLRVAVDGWAPGRGVAADPLHRIAAAWPGIVGDAVAAHAEPVQLNGNTLLVVTRSSAWSQQLQMLSPAILTAIRNLAPGLDVQRMTFRLGTLQRADRRSGGRRNRGGAPSGGSPGAGGRAGAAPFEPAADAAEALARLRRRVQAVRGAAPGACAACGAPLEGGAPEGNCAPCAGQTERERLLAIQRLVYAAPWLTHADLRADVPDLAAAEFERARRLLLQRWWLVLERAKRAGTLSSSGMERHVASSYVLLQSRLTPDRITPAVVANLLGDELVRLLWPPDGAQPAPRKGPEPGRNRSFVE